MDLELTEERVSYTFTVKLDDETRRLIHRNFGGYTDGQPANRDLIARWVTQLLSQGLVKIQTKFVSKDIKC